MHFKKRSLPKCFVLLSWQTKINNTTEKFPETELLKDMLIQILRTFSQIRQK